MEIFKLDMGQISSNILAKSHLQHDSRPFFLPASRFAAFLLSAAITFSGSVKGIVKRLFFFTQDGFFASCILGLESKNYSLFLTKRMRSYVARPYKGDPHLSLGLECHFGTRRPVRHGVITMIARTYEWDGCWDGKTELSWRRRGEMAYKSFSTFIANQLTKPVGGAQEWQSWRRDSSHGGKWNALL